MRYRKGKVSLYLDDCMEFMSKVPDNYYDLAVVDPPYGIGASSENHKSRNTPIKQKNGRFLNAKNPSYISKKWDDKPADFIYGNELERVCKDRVVFGGNYFEWIGSTFKTPRRENWPKLLKDHPKGWIIWDKLNGSNDFNDCELIYTTFGFDSFIYSYMWNGMMQGSKSDGKKQQGNKKLNEVRIHPTQKPIQLYNWIFHNYAKPEFKIFDSHGGSMSSAIAVYYFGCEFDCIELDKDYYNDAVKRFKTQTMQTKLF